MRTTLFSSIPLGLGLVLSSCGNNQSLLLDENPNPTTTQEAPACAAGSTALFAETAGDLSSFSAFTEEGETFGVFSGSNQVDSALFFFKMDRRGGVELLERLGLTSAEPQTNPSLTRSGSGFGVAWEDHREGGKNDAEIYFVRIDEGGFILGSEQKVSSAPAGGKSRAQNPTLVFGNDGYALAWADGVEDISKACIEKQECLHRIYFAKLSGTGTPAGAPIAISVAGHDAINPSLLWTGGGYLLAYSDTSGDSSPECATDKGECDYQTNVVALDRDGNVQKTSPIPGAIDGTLIQKQGEADAFLVAWMEGVYLASVNPAGVVTEIGKKVVPVRGVPQMSLAVGREGFWLALSDSPDGKKPDELHANDLHVYRISEKGELLEAKAIPISVTPSRSERPYIAALGDDALVLWREARPSLFGACRERPQNCTADLAVAKISCGEGVQPVPPTPDFTEMIPDVNSGLPLFGPSKKPETPTPPAVPPATPPTVPPSWPTPPPMGGILIEG